VDLLLSSLQETLDFEHSLEKKFAAVVRCQWYCEDDDITLMENPVTAVHGQHNVFG